jgi:hypothetical protein
MNIKHMRRYLLFLALLLAGFLGGLASFLVTHRLGARTADPPRETSVALVCMNRDQERRCLARTVYSREHNEYADSYEVVDPHCAEAQYKLEKAIVANDFALACAALAQGANPNSPGDDYDLNQPLPLAAMMDRREIVRLLLDNGADVNGQQCCCMSCKTPLTAAVEIGDVELVKLLIGSGANACYNIPYTERDTVLSLAEMKGNKEVSKLICDACANAWKRDKSPDDELVRIYKATHVSGK